MTDKDSVRIVANDAIARAGGDRVLREEREAQTHIQDMLEIPPFTVSEMDALKIIHAKTRDRKALNAFRDLRTTLLQASEGKNFVCLVSSLCDRGGASHVTANLAAVFALDQAKAALIIDGNLYDPSVDRLLKSEVSTGLTDFLSNPSLRVEDIIYASGIPRVRVIPVGENCDGGAEYFASSRMRVFMSDIKGRYSDRFVFVDAPPLATSSEAKILAEQCDMVILTVPYGGVTQAQVVEGIEAVGKEKLAGLVFNN